MAKKVAKAMDVARWFIKNNYDNPRNTLSGNSKLQKMLYFAQLIHLATYGDVLFSEPIHAFKNGAVVEEIRLKYRNETRAFVEQANTFTEEFTDEQICTLQMTAEIFGDAGTEELIELNHFHRGWKKTFERSRVQGNFYEKEAAVISIEEIKKYDLTNIKQMIDAHVSSKELLDAAIEVNGINFYYDPGEIEITPDLVKELKQFKGEESAYSIYHDESVGLVIF
jgi:uncharacterized phage-associated protein